MLDIEYLNLPYRNNVGCIVKRKNYFLLVQLIGWPTNFWKFPQGGIENGESIFDAGMRELKEELGSSDFLIQGLSKVIHQYDWPEDSIIKAGFKWRGQIQQFLLVEYFGKVDGININSSEIQKFRWVRQFNLPYYIDHDHPLFTNYKKSIEDVFIDFNLCK